MIVRAPRGHVLDRADLAFVAVACASVATAAATREPQWLLGAAVLGPLCAIALETRARRHTAIEPRPSAPPLDPRD